MKKNQLYQMTTCAIMAALMCVLGPMSVPIGPVPVTLTNLVLYLSVFLLGTKGATVSYLVYLLLGAVGLPVFSGYQGGLAKLAGPTGGYLVGFILMTIIGGLFMQFSKVNPIITGLGMALGTAVTYLFGTIWFVNLMKCEFGYALGVCVFPFIPFDLGKIVIACVLGTAVRAALSKANLLPEEK